MGQRQILDFQKSPCVSPSSWYHMSVNIDTAADTRTATRMLANFVSCAPSRNVPAHFSHYVDANGYPVAGAVQRLVRMLDRRGALPRWAEELRA